MDKKKVKATLSFLKGEGFLLPELIAEIIFNLFIWQPKYFAINLVQKQRKVS